MVMRGDPFSVFKAESFIYPVIYEVEVTSALFRSSWFTGVCGPESTQTHGKCGSSTSIIYRHRPSGVSRGHRERCRLGVCLSGRRSRPEPCPGVHPREMAC